MGRFGISPWLLKIFQLDCFMYVYYVAPFAIRSVVFNKKKSYAVLWPTSGVQSAVWLNLLYNQGFSDKWCYFQFRFLFVWERGLIEATSSWDLVKDRYVLCFGAVLSVMALLRYPVLPNFRCRIVSLQASDTATQKQLVDRSIDPAKDLEVCNTPLSPLIKSLRPQYHFSFSFIGWDCYVAVLNDAKTYSRWWLL